jgi:starvation-inducible DNA-binding protein
MQVIARGAPDRELLARGLAKILADTHALYAKTWRFHRDIGIPASIVLRPLLHRQGNDLARATGGIVDRMRSLGLPAQGWQCPSLGKPPVHRGPTWSAKKMVGCLVDRHEAVARRIGGVLPLAEGAADRATCDLLRQRLEAHEEAAWLLAEVGIAALVGEFLSPRRTPVRARPPGEPRSVATRRADPIASRNQRKPTRSRG